MKNWYLPQFGIRVYFTTDWTKIKDPAIRGKMDKDSRADVGGICRDDRDGKNIYIWIPPDDEIDFVTLVEYIAHEATHAVGFIYKHIGDNTKISAVSEPPAYYTAWLTGEILRHLGYE